MDVKPEAVNACSLAVLARMEKLQIQLNDREASQETTQQSTPVPKLSRSDVRFPLSAPGPAPRRPRTHSRSSITEIAEAMEQDGEKLTLRIRAESVDASTKVDFKDSQTLISEDPPRPAKSALSIEKLPEEIQERFLDFIFGDLHSVTSKSTSLQGKNVSSSMRHPRRKAVSNLALVSRSWRELVQGRIYRHIKIKGTRPGLKEAEAYFLEHLHLVRHIRHIEFWVPVWGDKASLQPSVDLANAPMNRNGYHQLAHPGNEGLNTMTANDLLGFNFKLSTYSATLSEIFAFTAEFFPEARIFTLEGGHCKKSNMIRHFPQTLFPNANQSLTPLPNISTFAMKGAWNIMREYKHWNTIQTALPNVAEWHCAYAKPCREVVTVVNNILNKLSASQIRHVNISLDGMYPKDNTTLGSTSPNNGAHLCNELGRIAPQLESLSWTGKICSDFWAIANSTLAHTKTTSRLRSLEVVVKSCCRRRIQQYDATSDEFVYVDEPMSPFTEGVGITNMAFIRAFELLATSTVASLANHELLEHIRIRFIDLDSPCALLNPYFQLKNGVLYGLWNEEILARLPEVRPGLQYEELCDGINVPPWRKQDGGGATVGSASGVVLSGGAAALYPKSKPKSIKSSSYRALAEARG